MVLNKTTATILFVLIVGNFAFYRGCKNNKEKYNEQLSYNTALKLKCDSILRVPPDTVKLPAKIIKDDSIVYVDRWHKPVPPTAQTYKDSLINDSIDVRVTIKADNLYALSYAYKPIYKYQETIVEKKVPYPVVEFKEVTVAQMGLFGGVGLGYGNNNLALKLDLLYLTKKSDGYGISVIKHGSNTIYSGSYFIKF